MIHQLHVQFRPHVESVPPLETIQALMLQSEIDPGSLAQNDFINRVVTADMAVIEIIKEVFGEKVDASEYDSEILALEGDFLRTLMLTVTNAEELLPADGLRLAVKMKDAGYEVTGIGPAMFPETDEDRAYIAMKRDGIVH